MLLCPSMLCADFRNIKAEVEKLEKASTDIFHCDIIDGVYAENLGLSLLDLRAIRASTYRRIDVHLMIKDPLNKIKWFVDAGADIVYFHPESEQDPKATIERIHALGAEAGLVIHPDIEDVPLDDLVVMSEYILLMSMNPSFSGQRFLDFVRSKLPRLLELKKKKRLKIILEGVITPEIVQEFTQLGIDGYILGTSSLFMKSKSYAEIMGLLRESAK
jgi:ribulose-phosphate 3-epimerase